MNRINQLLVRQTLQSTLDENIFAIGDCAACPWPEKHGFVPPRAQAAHQQASHMVGQIKRRLAGQPLRDYRYRDFGSLVSLSEYSTVGSLMGGLIGGALMGTSNNSSHRRRPVSSRLKTLDSGLRRNDKAELLEAP